jgi:hypothetical protein
MGPVCCEVVRYLLQTLRVHIYTLVLTGLLVDHDYNIYCLKLMSRRQCPSRTRHQFVPSLYSSHVITHSWMLPLPGVKQPLCQMMTCSRPQTSLPNALRKTSCRTVLSYQTRPIGQSLPCTNFWCNICPFNYGIKGDFIPELTINAQRPQAESVQHPFFPPSNRWSFAQIQTLVHQPFKLQSSNGKPRPSSSSKSYPPQAHSVLLFSTLILNFSFALSCSW